jgi:hypothetical protein
MGFMIFSRKEQKLLIKLIDGKKQKTFFKTKMQLTDLKTIQSNA